MKDIKRKSTKNKDPFFENRFSYAVVVRADIDKINELKQFLADNDFIICFQKISTEKLYIKED